MSAEPSEMLEGTPLIRPSSTEHPLYDSVVEACRTVLARDAQFILYSCHTPGFTPLTLENQLTDLVSKRGGTFESGEMTVAATDGRRLPSGTWARWRAAPDA